MSVGDTGCHSGRELYIKSKPAVQDAIDVACKENGKSFEENLLRARNILEVMVADTRYPLIRFLTKKHGTLIMEKNLLKKK